MSAFCVPRTRCILRQIFAGLPAAMHRHYSLDVSAPLLRTQGYVDGRWVTAASEFPVLDPATGKEIARVSDCGPAEAKQAVDAAHKAFHSWKQYTAKVCLHSLRNRALLEKVSIKQMFHIRQKSITVFAKRDISLTALKQTLIRRVYNSPNNTVFT